MITTTSQYALRSLVHLARLSSDTSILGSDLADRSNVPSNYLSKILVSLRNAGVVGTRRGRGGGYRLKKNPAEIMLKDVLELFEQPKSKIPCLLGELEECRIEQTCSADKGSSACAAWKKVCKTYISFLESMSVADLSFAKKTNKTKN